MEIGTVGAYTSSSSLEGKKAALKRACKEFESLFSAYLLKTMRSSVLRAEAPEHAREVYETMFDEAVAREISYSGAIGLGEMLYEQLVSLVEQERTHAREEK